MKTIAVLLTFMLAFNISWAQTIHGELPANLSEANFPTSLEERFGRVKIILFENGAPLINSIIVLPDGKEYISDEAGLVEFFAPEGNQKFVIKKTGGELEVPVRVGETTQVLLTVLPDSKDVELDLESSDKALKRTTLNKDQLNPGKLKGIVLDSEKKTPIEGARVFVMGLALETKTDKKGRFELDLPAGKHQVSLIHKNFSTQTLRNIQIVARETLDQNIEMTPTSLELEDFIVLAPRVEGSVAALIEVRKKSSGVADVLGAEQMSKAGDSDAAASLKRVTGLTLVDGKYVYVRGLGERYSSILLNNSSLPSPDPTRRVIPLDMFPSGIIKSMIIQKSYTPDLPAEFAGGSIKIETKSIPEEAFFKISTSYSYSDDTFKNKFSYQGGSKDSFGIDDGTRALPSLIEETLSGNRKLILQDELNPDGLTEEEYKAVSRSMPKIYSVSEQSATPLPNLSLSAGGKINGPMGTKFGFLASGRYANSWSEDSKIQRRFNLDPTEDSGLALDKETTKIKSEREIDLGGTLDLGLEIGKENSIGLSGILIRKTTDVAEVATGFNSNQPDVENQNTKLEWTERQLLTAALKGSHSLNKSFFDDALTPKLEWRYSQSQATRDQPDKREYKYFDDNDGTGFRFDTQDLSANRRTYSDLEDNNTDFGADFSVNFHVTRKSDLVIKTGFNKIEKERNSQVRRFSFEKKSTAGAAEAANQVSANNQLEDIITDDNIGFDPGQFILKDNTLPNDNYTATQEITAYYGMVEIPLWDRLKLISGARYEESFQVVDTFQLFDPSAEPISANLRTKDWLPVHSLTFKVLADLQIRAAYSETISRPDFKELSTSPYFDSENDRTVQGNNELVNAIIKNYDFRVEWYFTDTENVSLGIFSKDFKNPIEAAELNSTEEGITFRNSPRAKNIGAEFEFRKDFGFLLKSLKDLSLSGNYSWIQSEVETAEEIRPLQGQSPYVINLQLIYDNLDLGSTASLLYNVFGRRISEVGGSIQGNKKPDVYEEPFAQVDFVASQKFSKNYKVSLKAKNLLDPERRFTQGAEITQLSKRGRSFSLGLSGSF